MDRPSEHLLENLMFSFRYGGREQASRCNAKLQHLMGHSIFPELERSFEQVAFGEVRFELDRVEIDLGRMEEEELSEDLAGKIRRLLVEALGKAIRGRLSGEQAGGQALGGSQSLDFALLALRAFLLKGYFPAWADSRLNLHGLLDFLLASPLPSFGKLIREVSLKSESTRKRIAFLEAAYFDRIIAVLVPADAEWIVGYRTAYLEIHKAESRLTDTSENLGKALNLFILTFVVQNSGPKFNRFNFSDRFLKSVAAHYNLDFHLFLQEITEILNQYRISNQMYRDFKETVSWVGEQNKIVLSVAGGGERPSREELIDWLNQPEENTSLQAWLGELSDTGMLFSELSAHFPGFWRSLGKTGLTQLIRLLGGKQDRQWLDLVYSYLAWRSGNGAEEPLEAVRGIFGLAQDQLGSGGFSLADLDSWFFALASHGFQNSGDGPSVGSQLSKMGLKAGISRSPLIVLRAGKQAKEATKKLRESQAADGKPDPKDASPPEDLPMVPVRISEQALLEYLNTGLLEGSRDVLSKSDLETIVAQLIKNRDASLLDLLKRSMLTDFPLLRQRLGSLLGQADRAELFAYIGRFAGSDTLRLLRIHRKLAEIIRVEPKLMLRLDGQVWSAFLEEHFHRQKGTKPSTATSQVRHLERLFLLLQRFAKTDVACGDLASDLQRHIRFEKLTFLELYFRHKSEPSDLDALDRMLAAKNAIQHGFSLLEIQSGKLKALLQKGAQGTWLFAVSGKFLHQKGSQNPLSVSGVLQRRLELVQLLSRDSVVWPLSVGQLDQKQLETQAWAIVHQDLRTLSTLFRRGVSDGFRKRELRDAAKRILLFSGLNPESLHELLRRNHSRLPLILVCLFLNLKAAEWNRFAAVVGRKASPALSLRLGAFTQAHRRNLAGFWGDSEERLLLKNFLPSDAGLSRDLRTLAEISPSLFSKSSSHRLWRQLVILAAYQTKLEEDFRQNSGLEIFWRIFLGLLRSNRRVFQPESMDWTALVLSSRLGESSKAQLRRFFRRQFLTASSKTAALGYSERLSSAVLFWEQRGFLPWWSPFKSRHRLVSALLFTIENARKDEAMLLVSAISGEKLWSIVEDFGEKQLKNLLARLSSSDYKRHFSTLVHALLERMETLEKKRQDSRLALDGGIAGKEKSIDFKKLPKEELQAWIRREISHSREAGMLSAWFGPDSRIRGQMEGLLGWSRFMFFGALHPGKWKLWLLTFGFEFYVRQGKGHSDSFLEHFLRHLFRTQASVNWSALFRRLSIDGEFLAQATGQHLEEIKRRFPAEQERKAEEPSTGDQVKVSNAGLVLCWPFLSVLFSRLKLSAAGAIPPGSQSRAVCLLQYLAYGRTDFPEYELVLNKLLVGMRASQHLEPVELTEEEMQLALSLLNGMRSNWEKMKNASIDAIRETFLQREATLEFGSASNILRVPKTGVDVLLDSISWNISVVKLPWMEKSLEVKWR